MNKYPREWLDPPATDEVFDSMDAAQERLVAFSLSQGFDIVKSHSTMKPQPVFTFSCIHHGVETKNWRKLPHNVERDKEGKIIGERQREFT